MTDQPQNSRYKELLDELQLQSWQLELVISGFAIFGLFSTLDPLFQWFTEFQVKELWKLRYLGFAIYFSCILTIVNLILHVLLRGLWIGAVGVRSVSGEIEFDKLNFSPLITSYLKKKIVSFDIFIERLETYSSIMFGLTFLVVFITLGAFINFVLFLFFMGLVSDFNLSEGISVFLIFLVLGIFFVLYLLILIDFITRGTLKKSGGRFYLKFYRFTSILTLSVIYRPLLYNFWDNPFGKKLIRWLLPIYLVGIVIFSSSYSSTHHFSGIYKSSEQFSARRNYWDMIAHKGDHISYAAIPSKTITDPFLEVSIDYEGYLEEMIFEYDPTLVPKNSRTGWKPFIYTWFKWEWGEPINEEKEINFLKTINTVFTTSIDSMVYSEPFSVSQEINNSSYLKKFIDISELKNGKHILVIQRRTTKADSTQLEHYETIPFWYFKD